jgi:mono/diheme cytochrome c family protein
MISLDSRTEEQRARHAKAASAGPRAGPAPQGAAARGAQVYVGACAECHDRGREAEGGALPLPLATGLTIPTPRNLALITLDGILPEHGARRPWMPDYRGALTEDQLVDLLVYLRSLTPEPPWNDVREELRQASRGHE